MFKLNTLDDCEKYKGYWSDSDVYLNKTEHPVFIGDCTLVDLINMLKAEQEGHLCQHLSEIAEIISDKFIKKGTVDIGLCFARKAINSKALYNSLPSNKDRTSRYNALLNKYKNNRPGLKGDLEHKINALVENADNKYELFGQELAVRYDTPINMYRVNFDYFVEHHYSISDFIRTLFEISSKKIVKGHLLSDGSSVDSHILMNNTLICHPKFRPTKLKSDVVIKRYINAMTSGVTWVLFFLVKHNYLLLPINNLNLKPNKSLYAKGSGNKLSEYFLQENKPEARLYYRIYQSSTVNSIEDLSVDFCNEYTTTRSGMHSAGIINFISPINRYEDEHPTNKKFPIGQINRRRTISNVVVDEKVTNPEYYEKLDLPYWALSIKTYYNALSTSVQTKRGSISTFVNWAVDNKYISPWELTPSDIINPLNLEDNDTYYGFLAKNYPKHSCSQKWNCANRFITIVVNSLKPLPENDNLKLSNPFDGLINPFRQRTSSASSLHKTKRPPIPEEQLEKMIDLLFEFDANGEPTFTWAKSLFSQDWAERKNHKTGKFEKVWHPARTICLAVLLLIPLRGKQSRWLDQGLLDSHIWDIKSNQLVENDHLLNNYRYADNKNHFERYGRNSGVLQPLETIFSNTNELLGLFINTNKTKLWDSEDKTGYEIPWPDGSELSHSKDKTLKKKGEMLGLIYKIIKYQIEWMQTYDPNPTPVNYIDDGERYDKKVAHLLPVFTPIFRDLTSPITKHDGSGAHVPVSRLKFEKLFDELAIRTEGHYIDKGFTRSKIGLTKTTRRSAPKNKTRLKCAYDIHTLRVTGITNLLEMGVPAHVVSEFIAGHASLVMTLHYAKYRPFTMRQSIIDAFSNKHNLDNSVSELKQMNDSNCKSLLIQSKQFNDTDKALPSLDSLIELKGVWRYKNGGICPGASCELGGIHKNYDSNASSSSKAGMVIGGREACGNCRYFVSGPSFLLPQMLVANDIMLKMRELGRKRKTLWDSRAKLEVDIELEPKNAAALHTQFSLVSSELESIDNTLEPLIMEWCNRLDLFQRSKEKANLLNPENKNNMVLIGTEDNDDLLADLNSDGCEFSLVKQIVTQSELVGGRYITNELAEHKLREFVDRIMLNQNIDHLLIKIPNKETQRKASILLADAISILAGGDSEAQALAENSDIELIQKDSLNELAQLVISNKLDSHEASLVLENIDARI